MLQGRSRAGNAMARTRIAVLAGARQSLIAHGSKTTMVDIAVSSGVAKATLYNHFRTKSEVFAALIDHEITTMAAEAAELASLSGTEVALSRLAERVGEHPVVRKLAATEPTVLAVMLLPEQAGIGASSWQSARAGLTAVLGDGSVELLLRYLVSQLLWPAGRAEIEVSIPALLSATLVMPLESYAPAPERAPESDAPAPGPASVHVAGTVTAPGLGFPLPTSVLERVGL